VDLEMKINLVLKAITASVVVLSNKTHQEWKKPKALEALLYLLQEWKAVAVSVEEMKEVLVAEVSVEEILQVQEETLAEEVALDKRK
jgi:hypothetical protein